MTSVALSGAMYATTRSLPAAAGAFLGGFLIDADHYFDYLIIERQWRRPSPQAFLQYYFDSRFLKVVLPLHSWELMSVLMVISAATGAPLLVGYFAGALMHLIFDVLINGEQALRDPAKFYSFVYRASRGFSAARLLHPPPPLIARSLNSQFWSVRQPSSNATDSPASQRTINH